MPPRKTKSQVADCLLQMLCAEIVRSVIADASSSGGGGGGSATSAATTGIGNDAAAAASGATFADTYEARLATSAAYSKLEGIGYNIGFRVAERMTKDRPRLSTTLDIVKFLCKDFWSEVFSKQIDKLQTNHRGVYVLQDRAFRWLTRMSSADADKPKKPANPQIHRSTSPQALKPSSPCH